MVPILRRVKDKLAKESSLTIDHLHIVLRSFEFLDLLIRLYADLMKKDIVEPEERI